MTAVGLLLAAAGAAKGRSLGQLLAEVSKAVKGG